MVPRREEQADILVQAVQNHNPDVIIVDEIGTWQVRLAIVRRAADFALVLVLYLCNGCCALPGRQ
jgi:stage III sporulation protein SpoIIIAA